MNTRAPIAACLILLASSAYAQSSGEDLENFVNSIQSVEQVKTAITLSLAENCGTAACANNNATEVCAYIGALDIRIGNLITHPNPRVASKSHLPIADQDLKLMKRIWRFCKPTTDQYWNYGQIVHVSYDASSEEVAEIRKLLKAPK